MIDERPVAFEQLLDRLFARFLSVATAELDTAMHTTVAELGAFVGADRSYIIRYDWSDMTTTMTHEWCAEGIAGCFDMEQRLPMAVGPRQQDRLEALEVNQIDDVNQLGPGWEEDIAFLQSEDITAILEVPFALDGRLAGVIGFDVVTGPFTWRPSDVTALKAVASLLANVLARTLAEGALDDTVRELATVFNGAPVPLLLLDRFGTVLRANQSANDMFGSRTDELAGSNALERIHPDDLEEASPQWTSMLRPDGPDRSAQEVRFLTPAGYRWHRVDAVASRAPTGEFQFSTVHLIDVDEVHRTATQLGRSERRFGSLVESLPDAVMRFDPSHHVTFANAAAVRTSQEMAASGVVMRAGWPRLDPTSASILRESLDVVFKKGRPVTVEYAVGSDATEVWCESTFVPEFAADGSVESVLLVARDITHRRDHEAELAHRASHDALTGLPNRSMLLSLLSAAVAERADRHDDGRCLALLFLDVDRFKTVNDSLGHGTGDELLCRVAERLGTTLRPHDTLARLGGDEFTVLLPDIALGEATTVAARLQDSLREPIDINGTTFRPTVSIGVVETSDTAEPTDLLRWADAAMYEAKAGGRNRVAIFDERMRAEVSERNELDRDLTGAVDRNEFVLHFQPEVELATGRPLGCEALVRWRHPDRGTMSPDRFISLAEENGTIVALGRWVLLDACRTVVGWRTAGLVADDFILRVNLSARQLDQAGLARDVADVLSTVGLPPSRLCLEVTETALMRDVRAGMAALTELHRVGVQLAIDDFGTGYSSLSYLKRFPIDVLKVDRSFVDGLPGEAHDVAITTAILDLARSLELEVTAEGVETVEQRDALIELGCKRAQGYLFARPMPAEDLVRHLEQQQASATPTAQPVAAANPG